MTAEKIGSCAISPELQPYLARVVYCRDLTNSELWEDFRQLHLGVFGQNSKLDEQQLHAKYRLELLQAYDHQGKAVAFKLGYELKSHRFYSWLGGVLPEHRQQGIASELMRIQHLRLRDLGYREVETKTKNNWRQMLILNLKMGFEVVGTYTDHLGEPKIILRKSLL